MSYADRDGVIWLDGALVPWREAKVHVLTHTLHYGVGVFEGIRAYKATGGTAVFRLAEHVRRLYDSARIVRMQIPFAPEEIRRVCCEVIRENGLEEAYVRPMCFYGAEGMGLRADNLRVHVMVAAWSWGKYLGADGIEKGIRVRTSSYTRYHPNTSLCKAKANGNYMNSILALQEALSAGYDEALILDGNGFVAEGSGENFFMVRNGVIYTPELTAALEGITRDAVITLAGEHGYTVKEKRITRDEVYIADEAFFTGTAAEVTPIRELDDRPIGNGTRGPVTESLQSAFFDLVHGRAHAHPDWLTIL
ncbi:MAG: branched-chain amino acid transaminase [Gammaproteobacteria bacterium]|nr:branched-chain amino acid transaminase [Gammaproteobacteria bacterium]